MVGLHYSNRLEELVSPLAAAVRDEQTPDPLRRVTIVVPSRIVEEFLKLRLAAGEGVAANLEFPFLRRYLADIVQQAEPAIRVLDDTALQIAVFECLRVAVGSPEPDCEALRAYAAATPDNSRQRDLRLFQLSARIATLFREYSILRRSMLQRWRTELTLKVDHWRDSERWQRRIYTDLFDNDGSLKRQWTVPQSGNPTDNSRWMLLPDAFEATASERLRKGMPARVHIFGLGYVGPEFVRIFSRLGTLTELHIYALNPCLEFWEDVADLRVPARGRRPSRPPKVGEALETAEDPFDLDADGDNMALRHWGRAGREYIRLLNELTDCDFDPHFKHPIASGDQCPTLLARLQQMILLRQAENASSENAVPAHADGSIRFLECPGVRREVEITANAIWSLLRREPPPFATHTTPSSSASVAPLRFHQIAIVLPDSLRDSYLPHIESVFSEAHRIPLNIVDRRFNAQSRVTEAVELLLRLPLGRLSRHELTHILTHPAVMGAAAATDAESWSEWCRALGVHFGADERAFSNTYVPPAFYHWDQALKRLALGVFMAGAPSGENRVFRADADHEYLPYETPGDAATAAAVMVRTARGLLCEAQKIASCELSLQRWARLLSDLAAAYVHPGEAAGERVRDLVVRAIDSMAPEGINSAPVSYEAAADLALARINAVEDEQGRYSESGVVVGSLSLLRAIPFRVIFMLGMGAADFPEPDRRDLLDLRQAHRRAGDVSPAERGRYMFLETLLAARERIFFSCVARNAQTGDRLEPSGVIRDLQFILSGLIGTGELERLTVAHPVSSYDLKYFPDLAPAATGHHPELESFDRNARRGAQIAALRDDLDQRCGPISSTTSYRALLDSLAPDVRARVEPLLGLAATPAPAPTNEVREIVLPVNALKRYLECPLQGAARYALGMADENHGDDEDADEEPLAQSILNRTMLLREALWDGRGKLKPVERRYLEAFHLDELKGEAPVGPFAQAAGERDLEKLRLSVKQAAIAGVPDLTGWQQLALGGADEFVDVDLTLPPLILDIDLKRPDGTPIHGVRIRGRIGPLSPKLDRSIRCVAGARAKPTDFLDGFIAAIVLAAAGQKMPERFTAIAIGGDKDELNEGRYTRSFCPPSQSDACKYLTTLVQDMLSGHNDYFLPIESVEAIQKIAGQRAVSDLEIKDAIETLRDSDWTNCRSDFGPVREARNFPPCPAKAARAIIKRRFEPLKAIFEK